MDRDIVEYTQVYKNHDFEEIMVKYRRKKVLEILNRYQAKTILEIGCGLDSIFNYYKDFKKFFVVEPSKEFYQKAAVDKHSSNIYIYNDVIENCIDKLCGKNFDIVLVSGLLHEVFEPETFLRQMVPLMSSNTVMHINVPNAKSFHLLWGVESHLLSAVGELTETAKRLQQNTTFDLMFLSRLAESAGLTVIEKGSYFIKPFNHRKMQQCLNHDILDENLLDGLYALTKHFPDNGAEIYINCKLR